jgi:NADPH:quinone reductase
MRAIVMHETGGPEVLKLEEVPVPEAGPGQVLIRVEAIGVSYTEAALRRGVFPSPSPLPAVFGLEAAGVVTGTGDGVDPAMVGRRVVVMSTSLGSYAEYMAVSAGAVAEIPGSISSQDAVAVANFGAVALCLLRAARLTGSETVLVEVAAGGVGGYLTQLAHQFGAKRVIGTAGADAKRDYALGIGADEVADHTDPGWTAKLAEGGIDVAFESLAGETTGKLLPALRSGTGRILLYGLLQGRPALTSADLLTRGLTLVGCGGQAWLDRVQAARPDVFGLVAEGRLIPRIDSVFPLTDVVEAHQRFDDRVAIGKIVLTP